MFYIFLFIFGISKCQTTDLIKQADGVFTKLNSNYTSIIVSRLSHNLLKILDNLNAESTNKKVESIFNNIDTLLELINNNDTKQIITNIRDLTNNSKVYININDDHWQKIFLYIEILLILIIIIIVVFFNICIYKICKKKKKNIDLNLYQEFKEET